MRAKTSSASAAAAAMRATSHGDLTARWRTSAGPMSTKRVPASWLS